MKETEINLDDEGFEEITGEEKKDAKTWKGGSGSGSSGNGNPNTGSSTGNRTPATEQATGNPQDSAPGTAAGNKPDFNVVQTDRDKDGKAVYNNVGAMWKSVSKNGRDFYTLKIGHLKLLVFPNDRK